LAINAKQVLHDVAFQQSVAAPTECADISGHRIDRQVCDQWNNGW